MYIMYHVSETSVLCVRNFLKSLSILNWFDTPKSGFELAKTKNPKKNRFVSTCEPVCAPAFFIVTVSETSLRVKKPSKISVYE